ncbi:hypothetical protein BH09SUM1_BH09SUM1_16360 [soil metagenome]
MPPGILARVRIAAAVALFAVAALAYLRFGPHTMDDAFITYRYARNFAEGRGLVYNAGEYVLGYSTPAYALILAAIACTGFPLPTAGLILSGVGGAASLALLILLAKELGCEIAGWVAAFFLSIQPIWVIMISCGMETTLFTAALLGMFLQLTRGKDRWIGPLMALVVLFRYDGVLAAAVTGIVLWRAAGWKAAAREGAIALAIYAPWVAFAAWYYGSPIPHTIVAKDFLYQLDWKERWIHFHDYFTLFQSLSLLWIAAAILGVYRSVRIGIRSAAGPAWALFFTVLYFLKGVPILFFVWYLAPALLLIILAACVGVQKLLESAGLSANRKAWMVLSAVLLVAFGFQLFTFHQVEGFYGIRIKSRESYYQESAEDLKPLLGKGGYLMTSEVGALGWYLPDAYIIDGVGLVSTAPLEIRQREVASARAAGQPEPNHAMGGVQATLWMLQELKPDYFTSRTLYAPYEAMIQDPWFIRNYKQLHRPTFDAYDQFVFKREPSVDDAELLKAPGL